MTTIFRRAIIESVHSMQFWILCVISVSLFLANGILFCGRYAETTIRYDHLIAQFHPSTVYQNLYVSPAPLRFIHDGDSSSLPVGYTLQPTGVSTPIPGNPVNIKFPILPSLDWTFIISTIFTLLTILICYNAVSGERENGTLKLVLANRVSRVQFCMAKYGAVMCISAITITAGALANLAVILALRPDLLSLDLFISAGMVIAGAVLLCSFFAFVSIAVSASVRSSPIGLLILLVIWVCSAIIIPNTAPVIARSVVRSSSELQNAISTRQMMDNHEKTLRAEVRRKSNQNLYKTVGDIERDVTIAYNELDNRIKRQYEKYDNAMRERNRTARRISRLSPMSLFNYAVESVTRTGEQNDALFRRAMDRYSERYDRYILDKVGVLSISDRLYGTTVQFNGKEMLIMSSTAKEYKGSMSDFPRFQPPKFSLSEGLALALGDIAWLVIWDLFAVAGVFLAVWRMEIV